MEEVEETLIFFDAVAVRTLLRPGTGALPGKHDQTAENKACLFVGFLSIKETASHESTRLGGISDLTSIISKKTGWARIVRAVHVTLW